MRVPYSNLLAMALKVISPSTFLLFPSPSRALNSIGMYVSSYSPPLTLSGSVQAVNRNVYQQLGLDLQKNYIEIWVSADANDIARGRSGDKVVWQGYEYQLVTEVNWRKIDGWISVMAVEVAPYQDPDRVFDFTFDESFA